ncbi:MAG: PDZ domain-containing protein [Planctomycetota bacterium]
MNATAISKACRTLLAVVLVAFMTQPTLAQHKLAAPAIEAWNEGDLERAEQLWTQWARQDETTHIPWYNLACARSMRGDTDGAADHLLTAIERGFSDFERLKTDPSLRAYRATDDYTRLRSAWPAFLDRRIDTQIAAARQTYGPRYNYTKDEKLRVAYASAFDTITSRQAREDTRDVADWAMRNVLFNLDERDATHPDPWTLVVLPTQQHFQNWAAQHYGDIPRSATSQLGGSYDHDKKELVAIDLGSTLRHEFFHVLHWRSADRLGQRHPIWIQEGLASLVEDMDQTRRGRYEPVASWRTNSIKRLATQNKLPGIRDFAAMTRDRFTRNRPLRNYAYARCVFMYLHERGMLDDWYAAYTESYTADPTGLEAIEAVTNLRPDEFDREMRTWALALPEVYEQNRPPLLNIGAQLDLAQGDGPVVRKVTHANARRAGLRAGDIITGFNKRPVRDLNEFYRVLTGLRPGDRVELTYRRRINHNSTTIELVETR